MKILDRKHTREELIEDYTSLHEGLPPSKIVKEKIVPIKKPIKKIGKITEIQYIKSVRANHPIVDRLMGAKRPISKDDFYIHPYPEKYQQTIGVDANGKLVFWAGKSIVKDGGIEDNKFQNDKVNKEYIPPLPRSLITLGKLQYLRYKTNNNEEGVLEFSKSKAPILTRDEKGNLHPIGGSYNLRNFGEKKMRHVSRANPSMDEFSAGAYSAATVGAAALGFSVVMNAVFNRVTYFRDKPAVEGGVRIAAGILGAGAIASADFESARMVGEAWGVAGVVTGGAKLLRSLAAPQLARIEGTAPAAGLMGYTASSAGLPAGVPAGFDAVTGQACLAAAR